jgi:hypothetical protein
VQSQADLLQVVGAMGAPCRLARSLDGRQKQRYQDANDGNHDQKLYQCEAGNVGSSHRGALIVSFTGKKVTATFCPKGPEGASHKRWLSPFFLHE